MHRRGVAPSVGSCLAGEQRRTRTGSPGNSMRNDVSQAETGDPITLGVDEKGNGFIQAHGARGEAGLEGLDGFGPQRTGSFFPVMETFA